MNVIILEKKTEICFYSPVPFSSWEGCNYCAGGVSPRLVDGLRAEGIVVPDEVIESRPTEIVVHGDWKSIQLPVPEGREMLSVFRGSRPRQRTGRYVNFDTFLLHLAADEGAQVITADVNDVRYSAEGKPVVSYRTVAGRRAGRHPADGGPLDATIEADFAVFAGGVNRSPGMDLRNDPVLAALQRMIPGLRPPKVRKAVIAEMRAGEDRHAHDRRRDALHAVRLEGPAHRDGVGHAQEGLDHHRPARQERRPGRAFGLPCSWWSASSSCRTSGGCVPHKAELRARCCCNPNMTVGAAKNPFGDRVALTGDLAVARLYKDGLYSAYTTSSALADCVLDEGIDERSLARHYGPVVRELHADNRYGRVIFRLSHWVLAHPALSRVLYRAVITERMTTPQRAAPARAGALAGGERRRRLPARPGRGCCIPPRSGASWPGA